MNYGIKNISFDHSSSEVEGTAEVGKVVVNFRLHAGSGNWEAYVEGYHSATVSFRSSRDSALRAARKEYGFAVEANIRDARDAVSAAINYVECR